MKDLRPTSRFLRLTRSTDPLHSLPSPITRTNAGAETRGRYK